jgi:hypothetical protein
MRQFALRSLLIVFLPIAVFNLHAQTSVPAEDGRATIEQVLRTQQDAWNHHDLNAFMSGYWNSADLTFFSGAKQTSGWQATLDRYKATYASPPR